ncbi:MAG TPA: YfhO family protein [Gemmatimonadota bacterium]|nr:YfhO family protein [Gemmatimonadota bacterium]
MSARRKRKRGGSGRQKTAAAKAVAPKPAAPKPESVPADRERRVLLAFAGAVALATLVFFGSFVVDRDAMLFGTDMVSEAYQSRAFAVHEVQAGRGLPEWNPHLYGGMPFLSILPYPVWYPTSLLYFVMPLHRAIGWAFLLHFALAGILMYGLARELKLGPGPAMVAGAAYMFTGYLVSHLYAGQDGRMFAMQWTPALFLLAERAITRRRLHWFGWMAAVVVLQVFTPHVQMMYFAAMGVGAYVLFRLWQVQRADGEWKPALVLLGGFVAAYALAGLVALIEVWPTSNVVQFTHRAARDYTYGASWHMPPAETLAAIWPEFQGYLESYWGTNPFKLHTEYLGAVPVLLAALSLLARRSPRVWFFAALAAAGLLFAWATPFHRILWLVLPMMKSFRAPAMMYSVVALAVAVLAAYGAQTLLDRREALADGRHVAWKVLGGLGAFWVLAWFWVAGAPESFAAFWTSFLYDGVPPEKAAAVPLAMERFAKGLGLFALWWALGLGAAWLAVRGRVAPVVACAALAAITVVDLWRVDRAFYATLPAAQVTEPDATVRFLQGQPGPFRTFPLPDAYGPNDFLLWRIPSVTGSQKFRLAWWDDLVGEQGERLGDTRLWSLLDVRYVVSRSPIQMPELPAVQPGEKTVYAWSGPARPAWLVYRAASRPDGAAGWPAEMDPREIALLEPGVAAPPLGNAEPGSGTLRWLEREDPGRMALSVEAPADAILVLSEVWHPYWSATVDGAAVDVLQVNVALRGIPVPAGEHRVELEFSDPYLRYGAWGSGAGLVLLLGFLALTWRRRGAAPA